MSIDSSYAERNDGPRPSPSARYRSVIPLARPMRCRMCCSHPAVFIVLCSFGMSLPFEICESMSRHHQLISIRRQVDLAQAEWASEDLRRVRLREQFRSLRTSSRAARHLQRRASGSAGIWTTYGHLQELNRALAFEPLSDADADRLEDEARGLSDDNVLDRRVCAVTDTWVFPKLLERINVKDLPFLAMRAVLTGGSWCTDPIREYYNCARFHTKLKGVLLSPKGFTVGDGGEVFVSISKEALHELQALESRIRSSSAAVVDPKPPRFAIADGFVAGAYPEINDATCVELQAVGLAQVRGVVKVVYGGPGNVLNSHLLCWDNRDAVIASRIPMAVTRDQFQLILAGPMTPAQDILLAKRHECSRDRVSRVLECLRRVNVLYEDITLDTTSLVGSGDPASITTRLQDHDAAELVAQARARQASVARGQDSADGTDLRECTVVESQTVLLETTPDGDEHGRLARAFANTTATSDTFVARRSTSILQSSDPLYVERLFPHLFTFGVGGLSMQRRHRYSPRAVVLHYLNVSSNRFAEDPMFKLVMFDYLATRRVKSGVFLRVGQNPALATNAMRVTPAQLRDAMRYRADQRAAWKMGRSCTPAPAPSPASTLLKSINAAAAKMWGSNEERESMTRKVDSMTILYGAPSVFWTLTPNPDCSLVCAFWTGHDLPGGRPDTLAQCGELNMPCPSEMSRLVMSNTVVQAQYYKLCCTLLIDCLFGWDSKANKPKSRRGIFGFVEALVYAVEQQGRLFVHHHGVAWIAGLPKTQSDWERLLASDTLRAKFEQYCASIFAAELPVYKTILGVECPLNGCSGQLCPLKIPKKFRHILKSSVQAPVVATCDVCGKDFNEATIVSSIIDKQWEELDEAEKALSTSSAVDGIQHKFAGLSRHTPTANIQMSRLLLKNQVHAWGHTRSCVKGQNGTKCRYRFFRDLVADTGLNRNDEIVFRRRIGNQWLNPFVTLWRRVLHFNMDARILWSGQSLQATRYALQYAIKRQTVLDNVAVVEIAFQKRVSREMALQTTEYARGIGRLLSLAYSSSGVMEIGGPLATVILHEGEAVTFGCDFERLVLVEGLNILNRSDVEATVVSRNREMFTHTSIAKYINRSECLEGLSWYDYCSWICDLRSTQAGGNRRCTFVPENEEQLRVHVRNHGCRYLDYPRVPEIVGPRLPDATRLGNEDYEEQSELYYRMAALLYQPFRDPINFLGGGDSAKAHFERWRPFSSDKIARALERHQQYYICLLHAQEYRARQRAEAEEDSENDSVCDDDDILPSTTFQEHDQRHSSVHYEAVPAEFYSPPVDSDMESFVEPQSSADSTSPLARLLIKTIRFSPLHEDASFNLTVSGDSITRQQIKTFQTICQDAAGHDDSLISATTTPHCTEITVETYDHATRNLSFNRARPPPVQLGRHASIEDISAFYGLNYLQHVAFTLIAIPLLQRLSGGLVPMSTHELFDNSPVIVTGAGGTGKSQIIAAVRALTASWEQPLAVAAVASTGIAAASLQGMTMHSSVGLGINTTKVLPKHITSPPDSVLKHWAPVHCVIADEVSMVDLGFFGLWEESLQYVKDNRGEDYGGLLVVLMFDHCQLRAVKGMPMYRTVNGKDGKTPLTAAQDRGLLLYRRITKAVYLTENMRFAEDPEWGQWLASGRLGNWSSDMRAFITSLGDRCSNPTTTTERILQTISTDNSARAATNELAIKMAVRCFGNQRKVYIVPALLSRRLLPDEIARIRQLSDNHTGHIPLYFQVYIGMPVRVKANQCIPKGVANGAAATVFHIDWDPATTFSLQADGTWLASSQPLNIYVNIVACPSAARYPAIPLHWPASVMPVHKATASVKIGVRSVSLKGFPLVPAFGTTVYGVQGETLKAVAITSLRPAHVRRVDPHALYVALSRLRTRQGLHWIGLLPTPEDFDFFRPDAEVVLEDNRLKRLSDTTVARFSRISTPNPRTQCAYNNDA